MSDLFLGLDVGTQGAKGLLIDAQGAIRGRASTSYGLIPDLPSGHAEQHPSTWVQAVREVVARIFDDQPKDAVCALSVSGQQHGFVALDSEDEVLRPAKLWCDTSTANEAEDLSAELGKPVPPGFTASKILWLKRHEPHAFDRLRHVLLPHDYLNFVLTGEKCMECGDASGTGFFDVERREFSKRDMAAISPRLSECLPPLRRPGEWAGHLSRRGAELLGLREGVPVALGGGDNMMSAVGSGATAAGVVVASLGTSGTVFCHSDRPMVDLPGGIASFCGSTGGWLPLLCVMNLTGVTQAVRDGFGLAAETDLVPLTHRASEVPAGCDGLLWLPFLTGERVPNLPRARGSLLGMTADHLRPEVLFRAAIEGTSINLALGMEHMRAAGLEMGELRLVGGAAANPLWCRILADVTELAVRRLRELESAAFGAALQAAWTWHFSQDATLSIHAFTDSRIGLEPEVVQPSESVALYESVKEEFRRQVQNLYGVG